MENSNKNSDKTLAAYNELRAEDANQALLSEVWSGAAAAAPARAAFKSKNSDRASGQLPEFTLALDAAPAQELPVKVKLEEARQKEAARASKYLEAHQKADHVGKAVLLFAALPEDLKVAVAPGKLNIQCSDFTKIAECVPGAALDPSFRSILAGIKSAKLDGAKFSVEGKVDLPVELGTGSNLKADLKMENPSFELKPDPTNKDCIHLENISGVSASMLGIGGEIKRISLTLVKDEAGRQSLQIDIPRPVQKAADPVNSTDSRDKFAQFAQGLKSKLNSRIPENSRVIVPLDSSETAQILVRTFASLREYCANPGQSNPRELAAKIAGADLPSVLGGLLQGIQSVEKRGDKLTVLRDKGSSHDFGGVVVDAAQKVQAQVRVDGESGFRLSSIQGVHLKLPVQLPEFVRDAGIDPGSQIHTNLKTFNLSSPDTQGHRKVLFETDHLLRQVGLLLGNDMKPALDRNSHWYMYGFVDNPAANQKLPLALRFDSNNKLAMSTQELLRIGSLAAWQAKDNGGLEGAGFGVIAVATEAGALALDAKDAVVDTAIVVKDKVVEGAVVLKDTVVEGAVIVGSTVKDGAVYLGNKISDGASSVGGLLRSGWRSVFGD